MPSKVALVLGFAFVVFLFVRDHKNHPSLSPALWIPLAWLFFTGSRSLSSWLHLGSTQIASIEAFSEGNSLDRYFLLFLFILATRIVIKRNLPGSALFQQNKLIIYFILYCLISILWSEFPFIALKRLVRFLGVLPMCFLILSEHSPTEAVTTIVRRCSYLLITLSFLFVRYFPQFGRYYNPFTYETAYCGVGNNKNELGMICLISALIFFWDLTQKKDDKRSLIKSTDTWTTILLLAVTAYLVRISDSSTAIFCIVVSSLIIIGTSLPGLRKSPHTIGYRVLGISIFLASVQVLFNISNLIIKVLGRNPTLTDRTFIWKLLLGMGTNPILGAGYESFWTTGRIAYVWSSGHGAIQAHNGYIDTYLNLGLIGALFFGALLIRCFRIIVVEMPEKFAFNQLRLAFLIVFALYNYTEAAFPRPGLLLAIFFLFIIIIPQTGIKRTSEQVINDISPA